jgi:hypothetical protein
MGNYWNEPSGRVRLCCGDCVAGRSTH